jgi:ankyrin repeat protein
LLAHGAKVNVASKHGWTPLMTAAWEGHTMIVKELLKHGADTKLMTTERRSAQMLAESEGHREIVKLLGGK